jgi:hypothetical protein
MVDYRKRYVSPDSKGYHQGRDERRFKSEYVGKLEPRSSRRFITVYPLGFNFPRISSRIHPRLSKRDIEEGRKRKENALESLAHRLRVLVSFGSIVAGGFFLSNKLTGFAVGNLSLTDANITGVVMFALGISGLLLFLRE